MTTKFEYLTVLIGVANASFLNSYGAQGWELVSVVPSSLGMYAPHHPVQYAAFMKRKIDDQE